MHVIQSTFICITSGDYKNGKLINSFHFNYFSWRLQELVVCSLQRK
jgi:hypothetical protein